ncbi:MAG: hypothetical protein EZS28_003722 [Streblomastix strix]|uniref:Uncharacterized protein n=1 Tax=Streblomastix strix TaxID=222440 RepID=A0A5J4X0D2_9EUKA|nr:MAG: hypothetical protein EZS28_003722 [Streblomastix strix]
MWVKRSIAVHIELQATRGIITFVYKFEHCCGLGMNPPLSKVLRLGDIGTIEKYLWDGRHSHNGNLEIYANDPQSRYVLTFNLIEGSHYTPSVGIELQNVQLLSHFMQEYNIQQFGPPNRYSYPGTSPQAYNYASIQSLPYPPPPGDVQRVQLQPYAFPQYPQRAQWNNYNNHSYTQPQSNPPQMPYQLPPAIVIANPQVYTFDGQMHKE